MTGDVRVLNQDILVASILLGLTALVGLLGNLLMLRALVRYPSLRVDFFLFLGSLAVVDIVSLCISVPRHIIQLTHADISLTDAWCNASKYLEVGTSLIAAWHLVAVTVLRFILYSTRVIGPPSPVRALAVCGALWLILLLVSVPFLGVEDVAEGLCEYVAGSDVEKDVWMINSFVCFLPIAVMVGFYALTHVMSKRFFADSYSARERQMSRLVTVLVACFAVCQLPFRVFDIVLWYREDRAHGERFPDVESLESMYIAKNYLLCLMMADKAARPVIYAKVGPQLSEAFDEVINCTLCHRAYTQARSGQPSHNRSALAAASSKAANGHHNSRIHSTSSNAPLTAMSEVTTSDATNVTDVMVSAEELEIVPLS